MMTTIRCTMLPSFDSTYRPTHLINRLNRRPNNRKPAIPLNPFDPLKSAER